VLSAPHPLRSGIVPPPFLHSHTPPTHGSLYGSWLGVTTGSNLESRGPAFSAMNLTATLPVCPRNSAPRCGHPRPTGRFPPCHGFCRPYFSKSNCTAPTFFFLLPHRLLFSFCGDWWPETECPVSPSPTPAKGPGFFPVLLSKGVPPLIRVSSEKAKR